jgi:hypothetical protein
LACLVGGGTIFSRVFERHKKKKREFLDRTLFREYTEDDLISYLSDETPVHPRDAREECFERTYQPLEVPEEEGLEVEWPDEESTTPAQPEDETVTEPVRRAQAMQQELTQVPTQGTRQQRDSAYIQALTRYTNARQREQTLMSRLQGSLQQGQEQVEQLQERFVQSLGNYENSMQALEAELNQYERLMAQLSQARQDMDSRTADIASFIEQLRQQMAPLEQLLQGGPTMQQQSEIEEIAGNGTEMAQPEEPQTPAGTEDQSLSPYTPGTYQHDIDSFIRQRGGTASLGEMYEAFPSVKRDTLRQRVGRMVIKGDLERPEKSVYRIPGVQLSAEETEEQDNETVVPNMSANCNEGGQGENPMVGLKLIRMDPNKTTDDINIDKELKELGIDKMG